MHKRGPPEQKGQHAKKGQLHMPLEVLAPVEKPSQSLTDLSGFRPKLSSAPRPTFLFFLALLLNLTTKLFLSSLQAFLQSLSSEAFFLGHLISIVPVATDIA